MRLILLLMMAAVSCSKALDVEEVKNEILDTENAFEKMASELGLAEAFYFFADENAVINRGNDSLIYGKEGIRNYYDHHGNPNARLTWTPDFVEVAACGTLGYTYGRYVITVQDSLGTVTEQTGIFHTVWKKQNDGWRYVWD